MLVGIGLHEANEKRDRALSDEGSNRAITCEMNSSGCGCISDKSHTHLPRTSQSLVAITFGVVVDFRRHVVALGHLKGHGPAHDGSSRGHAETVNRAGDQQDGYDEDNHHSSDRVDTESRSR